MPRCVAPRSKAIPTEQCSHEALAGTTWCGYHRKSQAVFVAPLPLPPLPPSPPPEEETESGSTRSGSTRSGETPEPGAAARRILACWRRHLVRKAGPLLFCREHATNAADFYTMDDVTEIPMASVLSFVDPGTRKGYIMDAESAEMLVANSAKDNPFNRNPLPPLFHRRLERRRRSATATAATATKESPLRNEPTPQNITTLFCAINALGFYSDPVWFQDLGDLQVKRLYIELRDIWIFRCGLSAADRTRICATVPTLFAKSIRDFVDLPFLVARKEMFLIMRALVTSAAEKEDQKQGALFVLGALSLISNKARDGVPWLHASFFPPVSRVVVHPLTGMPMISMSAGF